MMGCSPTGDEYGPEPVMYGPPITPDTLEVDAYYLPKPSELQDEWAGKYQGWDEIQEVNVTIRRLLALNPDSTYTNKIGGLLKKEGNDKFILFESEYGTYLYNPSNRLITYTVIYDSVLNFRDQTFTVYTKKHYYDYQTATYTEKVQFTIEREGKRGWITEDPNLWSHEMPIKYVMNRFRGDK